MSEIRFAAIADDDRAGVIALWRTCGLTRPWNDPAADISFALSQPNATILAGRDGAGTIVATVMVGHDGHRGWVYFLATDPAFRRQGLGRQAMAEAEAWLRARGVWKLNILVRSDNDDVLAFYRDCGFGDDDCVVLSRRLDGRTHCEPLPGADDWS